MGFPPKPSDNLPTWATGDPEYATEPSSGKKATGWLASEKPPFQWMNWLFKAVGVWLGYADECIDEVQDQLTYLTTTVLGDPASNDDVPNVPWIPPIGAIIPFYEFAGPSPPKLTYNNTYWVLCDGGSKTVGGHTRTVPDLSGRYIVGFGTDGGQNIGTAEFGVDPEGNVANLINISHSHPVDPPLTASTGGTSHQHTLSDLAFGTHPSYAGEWFLQLVATVAAGSLAPNARITKHDAGPQNPPSAVTMSRMVTTTESSHTHNVDIASFSSSSALSDTQDIRPRSIRVRYLMRAK